MVDFTIAGNTVSGRNGPTGISIEISDTGVVAGNRISHVREGITIFNSGNIAIANNQVSSTSVWDVGLTQDSRRQAADPLAGTLEGRSLTQPVRGSSRTSR